MHKFQSHCSGHARGSDLLQAVKEINAKTIYPIHTEYPDAFKAITNSLVNTVEGKTYQIS